MSLRSELLVSADRSLWSRLRIGVTDNHLLTEPRPQGAIVLHASFRSLVSG